MAASVLEAYSIAKGFPNINERVVVIRKSGKKLIAYLGFKPDSIFREAKNLHWLEDNSEEFANVAFDPIIDWYRF